MKPLRQISLARPSVGEEEWRALREPINSGWLAQGPEVEAFERDFARRHSVVHARATSSGTAALHLVLAALEIGPGDEVIVPAFTWVATANAVSYCGATPVFADVDVATFNLDPQDVARRVTERTRAVIAVHLFGLCAEMDGLRDAAPKATLIEDAACATGASYHGRSTGGLGVAAAFSFHPRKLITTGEGGMVTTSDEDLAERIAALRNHGLVPTLPGRRQEFPDIKALGFNYRMTDMQAAMGIVQLRKLDALIAERQRWAAYYAQELGAIPWIVTPTVPKGLEHTWQSYVLRIDESTAPRTRDEIMASLEAEGIATRPGSHAVHRLGLYRERLGTAGRGLDVSLECARTSMAIPLHSKMSEGDYESVVAALKRIR
jgi:dTDP-4-amino-4,6-dideoxygalactose transaminase